ncbi:aa3-type cytochrome c oxidase subunit IV [Poseidonocella sp. HB161398]|nr:aa3-type cytochrome c oxidase subunit IV [Poseidonocella sp. HB161398]
MAAYKHGTMDISDHEKTFAGFVKFTTRTVIGIFVLLIFLALVGA